MSIDRREVERIARLARLEIGPDEADTLAGDLDAILDEFDRIREVASPSTRETDEPDGLGQADLHEDRPDPDPLHHSLEEMAAAWREGLFVLPRLPALQADGAPPRREPEDR